MTSKVEMLERRVDERLRRDRENREQQASWPKLHQAALHGIAGDVVGTIRPQSESDPVAILIQTLVYFGNQIGRSAYYRIEDTYHHTNLYSALTGTTADARKGTSEKRVRAIFRVYDQEYCDTRIRSGLSSGEGFINQVRDELRKYNPKTKENEIVEPAIVDKRLMVIEPEFAGALAVMERHGNTLSPVVRKAWDGEILETMTRASPIRATGAHISIAAHITPDELRARLTRTDIASGFANRYLFPLVKRSQFLPFGGADIDREIAQLAERLNEASRRSRAGLVASR
jgi:hypothetical protein